MTHITILGDSIFDNRAYVKKYDVTAQLERRMPEGWTAARLAVDGARVKGVAFQQSFVSDKTTHLFISIGGNDSLDEIEVLDMPVTTSAETLLELGRRANEFEERYEAMLKGVFKLGIPTCVCTVYYPNFTNPLMQKLGTVALTAFNDVIIRQAFKAGIPIIDLRAVCSEPADYANEIEPSDEGGAKIADAIIKVVNEHDFSKNRTSIYS